METIITISILILSIVLHEVAHGYAANWLGDPTARLAGRLTPNPIPHIDPVGSILIPGFLFISGAAFMFGWAKPVPYNPYNLRNQKWGEAFVAAAGPLTNFLIAVIFAGIISLSNILGLDEAFMDMLRYIVMINVLLGVFNLIPLPPLDGSKVIVPFLPRSIRFKYEDFMRYVENLGFIALFAVLFIFMHVLWAPFQSVVYTIVNILI